ncbi:hypothetical protein BGZ83_011110 [Gryganskiella cystojenkinii]|nr:hypothetical protein BGZ83_011110 [Gryganskiella cystojenkinii]
MVFIVYLDAQLLLEQLSHGEDAEKNDIYRSRMANDSYQPRLLETGGPEVALRSLLDRVQKRTDVEADLRRIARQRMKERATAVFVPPLAKSHLQESNDAPFPLIPKVDGFLKGRQNVLLLLGDSGVGKTTFNRELDLRLWRAYRSKTGRIPLLVSLPAIERPDRDLIAKHLRLCGFSDPQIRELRDREFVVICDGYDESQQTQNLYESNGWNNDGGWKVQMVVSCRSEYLGQDYQDWFRPNPSSPTSDLNKDFRQIDLVPFSEDQVQNYIDQYVTLNRPLWEVPDYLGVLNQIPSLQDLVKNPFLLTLTLEVLPRLTDPGQELTDNNITRVQLYDEFVVQWLEMNKKKFSLQDLPDQEKKACESHSDDRFAVQGLAYLKNRSVAIYNKHGGNPVVEYSRTRDVGTWKEQFFGRKDDEIQLLKKSIPMTRNGTRFGFIHRSILEYGVSCAIYEPTRESGLKLETVEKNTKRRDSFDSTFSFEAQLPVLPSGAENAANGPNPESILAKRSFIKDPSVMDFLVERVQSSRVFKDQLMAYIEASKTDKTKWRVAAANTITILVRAGIHFTRQGLRGIQVSGADLSYGVFDTALLQGADLRKTVLQNTWLRKANLIFWPERLRDSETSTKLRRQRSQWL